MQQTRPHNFKKWRSEWLEKLPKYRPAEEMAALIKNLSDRYISKDLNLHLIWDDARYLAAYLTYFMPLNWLRAMAVIAEAKDRQFFASLDHVIDFGSGSGTFHLAAAECLLQFESWQFIEKNEKAARTHQGLIEHYQIGSQQTKFTARPPTSIGGRSLVVFSYFLNEIPEFPIWALDAEALMIIEPSTEVQSRKLQELRKKLILAGFSIWAPCTHGEDCPLLIHSKTDWCHNRIHVDLPKSIQEIEAYLPMKNQTLTYSYLLARKTKPQTTTQVRVIGDTLYERGKIRQSVCRSSKREFLTWLTRFGEPEVIARGSLFDLPENVELKGNELRITTD